MATRIVTAVLVLITVLLAILAIPLGMLTAGQDRTDFGDQTRATAASVANAAEEWLGEGVHGTALTRSITQLTAAGDRVAVYTTAGQVVAARRTSGQHRARSTPTGWWCRPRSWARRVRARSGGRALPVLPSRWSTGSACSGPSSPE